MSVISGCVGPFVGAAREVRDAAAVIFAKLLGDVVVAVDQRRLLEDAVDPRLDLGIDRLGLRAGGERAARLAARRSLEWFMRAGLRGGCGCAQRRGLPSARMRVDEWRR